MPVTIPVVAPTVAINTSLLDHIPPGVASDKAEVVPGHSLAVPVMAATTGKGLTTSVCVTNEVPHVLTTI